MIDVPLERLLQIGYRDLHRNQEEFRQTAERIDSHKLPRDVLLTLTKDHPSQETLLETVPRGRKRAARLYRGASASHVAGH